MMRPSARRRRRRSAGGGGARARGAGGAERAAAAAAERAEQGGSKRNRRRARGEYGQGSRERRPRPRAEFQPASTQRSGPCPGGPSRAGRGARERPGSARTRPESASNKGGSRPGSARPATETMDGATSDARPSRASGPRLVVSSSWKICWPRSRRRNSVGVSATGLESSRRRSATRTRLPSPRGDSDGRRHRWAAPCRRRTPWSSRAARARRRAAQFVGDVAASSRRRAYVTQLDEQLFPSTIPETGRLVCGSWRRSRRWPRRRAAPDALELSGPSGRARARRLRDLFWPADGCTA